MAKIIHTESHVELVSTEVVTQGATIFLSQDELDTLTTILRRVGGSPYGSPRRHADSIYDAIYKLSDYNRFRDNIPESDCLFFNDII